MCELLGMSANTPTDLCFSLTGLLQRGGRTGPHRDGWGVAFYEGKGCRVFHDPSPGYQSEIARLLQRYPIKSCNVICHIRQATHGRVALENTHPFRRELWGRHWVFAHNGRLRGVKRALKPEFYRPVGSTDSEHAFCWLLGEIRRRFPEPPRNARALQRFVFARLQELDHHGSFNMLLSDGRALYAYCSTRLSWITRRAPFGPARLSDAELEVDFEAVTTPDDIVTVVATRPLTDNEVWNEIGRGSMVVFHAGIPTRVTPDGRVVPPPERPRYLRRPG